MGHLEGNMCGLHDGEGFLVVGGHTFGDPDITPMSSSIGAPANPPQVIIFKDKDALRADL